MPWIEPIIQWSQLEKYPLIALILGIVLLLVASELVVLVLQRLEDKNFGTVQLGTLFTPLCTGFPNLMLGLFGQSRLSGDLVLHLNIANNIANTTLVTGTLLFIAGPLVVRPFKGKSKKAKQQKVDYLWLLAFFWGAAILLTLLARDGTIDIWDGALLVVTYTLYQALMWQRRGKPSKAKSLAGSLAMLLLLGLLLAALLIALSVEFISLGISLLGNMSSGPYLGMILGLLMVLPESFLLMRLAFKQGSLGLSGIMGDCFVSIPLVIGLSALFFPFKTQSFQSVNDPAAMPFLLLFGGMTAFCLLALKSGPVPRKVGLFFIGLYALSWWLTGQS